MSKHPDKNSSQQAFDILEEQIKALIETCAYLKEENRLLRAQQERLQEERLTLMEKNQTARSRVGAIITRLKSLEANT
ncbi:TIGR02449 family protein [Thiolapillus sp.]